MASIVQRRNSYTVVYYTEINGQRKQKWEAFRTREEALQRKELVEPWKASEKKRRETKMETVEDLLRDYVALYGKMRWSMSNYQSNTALIRHYILPFMGSMRLCELSPRVVSALYQRMLSMPRYTGRYQKRQETISCSALKNIHKALHSAFE